MAESMVTLRGSIPRNQHKRVGPVDPNERIEVTVKLRRKTELGLPTVAEFVAGERARLTRAELAQRYGSDPGDAIAVQHWATQQDLSTTSVDLGKRELHLTGLAGAMSKAFGVKLSRYKHARTKREFRCPESEIQIPKSLQEVIRGVFGLDNMPVVVRHGKTVAKKAAATGAKTKTTTTFYPNEVAKLYNFPPTQGDGQRVGVLEFGGGFDQSVVANYFKKNLGLAVPPTVNSIPVGHAQNDVSGGATGEVYLDIEITGGMAPKATIDVYFADGTGEGYLNSIEQAIHNDDYAGISISYGFDEDAAGSQRNPGWDLLQQSIEEAFRDASALGIPLFVSSGDQGSSSLRGFLTPQADGEITVNSQAAQAAYPASSVYATAVGGTMLFAKNGAITNEVVWNELGDAKTGAFYVVNAAGQLVKQSGQYYLGGATGGGVSDRYTAVPSYQSGAGIAPRSANPGAGTGRGVPDVAGNAGLSTGYLVTNARKTASVAQVGGTSAAAPMWAALMACVRESLSASLNGKVPVFFLNDFIYANGKSGAFRDIVGGCEVTINSKGLPVPGAFTAVGNNRSTGVDGYNTAPGYDLCTGWGSPNGVQLVKQLQTWLQTQPATSTNVTPAQIIQASQRVTPSAAAVLCKTCKSTTAVDLKVAVTSPSVAVVSSLPKADYIAITWTAAETEAAAQVFGKGQYKFLSGSDNNFTPLLFPNLGAPSREKYHGHFMTVTVNGKTLLCLKSEFHPKLQPSETTLFFERIVASSAQPNLKCLITSGTSGGIWSSLDVGDVVVTNRARFGLTMTVEQQALEFDGLTDVVGSNPPMGFATWYDYVNAKILATDSCLSTGLGTAGGRKASSGKPKIHYQAPAGEFTDVVTNSRITDDEYGRIATYRTLGATLDENDAYVASALKAVSFSKWVSIRNVSDLPSPSNSDDQYDRFGQCSSICGAYAIWAFIMGQ